MGDMPSVHSSYEALKRESETEELSNFEYWDPAISKAEEKDFKKHERMTGLQIWRDNTDSYPEDAALINDASGVRYNGPVS